MIGAIITTSLLLVFAVIIIVIGKRNIDQYKQALSAYEEEINSNKKLVYVSTTAIPKGAKVSENNIMMQEIYTGLEQSYYMGPESLGSLAITDIRPNEPIMSNMVSPIEFTDDLRTYELTVAHLMTTQADNDYVDVRVMFPNGEDYVILGKKRIQDMHLTTNVFSTLLNEDEILRMSSAIVDAYTTTGAKIYTTKYLEPNVQVAAIPNYPVKPAIIELINRDPNILDVAEETLNAQARMDLDARLHSLTEEQLRAVSEGLSLDDTAKNSIIREGAVLSPDGEYEGSENYEDVVNGDAIEEESPDDSKTNDNSTGGELTEADTDATEFD